MSTFINWVVDTLMSQDVLDLYFICTDLKDNYMTDDERREYAAGDSQAMQYRPTYSQDEHGNEYVDGVPTGKYVG